METKIRPIAIYLPQFHPISENDEWWGKGFTEWTNVTKAKPLIKKHYQPHLPADMGFYDLRVPETRKDQADLAKKYGIYGFCYYHYWFNGRRIMDRPFQEVFESKSPDFPFMLCWANENWTRVWDGGPREILLEQKYSKEDDLNHIKSLIPYFNDSRYIKIDGKPVFIVYKSVIIPHIKETISIWREEAAKHGLELYLCRFENMGTKGKEYLEDGFDAAIEFQPQFESFDRTDSRIKKLYKRVQQKLFESDKDRGLFVPYKDLVNESIKSYNQNLDYKLYRTVCPSWDNSSRRKIHFMVFLDSTPELFQYWVESALDKFKPYSKDENLFFINAWNEWAEGNHLEPDRRWGTGYLDALKKAVDREND